MTLSRVKCDIWVFHEAFVVIPINLVGVCGRGLAKQMVQKFPGIGGTIRMEGSTGQLADQWARAEMLSFYTPEIADRPRHTDDPYYRLVPFPVKRHWSDEANLDIIHRSCAMLVNLLKSVINPYYCAMPQVGCGFGELTPEVVIPLLEEWLEPVQDRILLVEPDPAIFAKYANSFKPGVRSDRSAVEANVTPPLPENLR